MCGQIEVHLHLFACRSCQNAYCTDLSIDLYICLSTSVGRSVCPSRLSVYMSVFLCWLSCDLCQLLAVYNMVYLCLVPSIRAWWPFFHILKQCRIWIRLVLPGCQVPIDLLPCVGTSTFPPLKHKFFDGRSRWWWGPKDLEYHAVPPDCPIDATTQRLRFSRGCHAFVLWGQVRILGPGPRPRRYVIWKCGVWILWKVTYSNSTAAKRAAKHQCISWPQRSWLTLTSRAC